MEWGEDFEATVKMCVEQGMDEEEAFDFVIQSITGDVVHAAPPEPDEWYEIESDDEWIVDANNSSANPTQMDPNNDNEGLNPFTIRYKHNSIKY